MISNTDQHLSLRGGCWSVWRSRLVIPGIATQRPTVIGSPRRRAPRASAVIAGAAS